MLCDRGSARRLFLRIGAPVPHDLRMWIRRLTLAFCVLAIVLGAIQAWSTRFDMNPDGVQYLDNADAYRTGDFHHALNSQWSPLYPWIIGAAFNALGPSRYQQFPVVHLLNFVIYLLSLASFLLFVTALRKFVPDLRKADLRTASFLLIAYSSFLYCSLDLTNLANVTPDLLVSLFAFLTAALFIHVLMEKERGSAWQYVALGVTLGLGYLAKTPFLIYALLCLGISFVLASHRRPALLRAVLATAVFAVISVPYIGILSSAKGRFTFGDSAKFNVIWMVNGVPYYHWQGGPPDNGRPLHPTRQLATAPAIFEFATPIVATYPPWYDPIYWSEGAHIAYRPADFARAIVRQLRFYGYLLNHRQLPLVFALLTLFLLAPNKHNIVAHLRPVWPVLVFALAPFLMYAPISAEARYLAPFFVLLWTTLAIGLLKSVDTLSTRAPIAIAAVASLLMLAESFAAAIPTAPIDSPQPPGVTARLDYEIARDLEHLGLKSGDEVAIVTGPILSDNVPYYWARLTGARIGIEVSFSRGGARQREAEWWKAESVLASNRVAFVVSPAIAGVSDQPGWRELGHAGVFAYPLVQADQPPVKE
jgi:4-amino-4-deoxy-L-arabinose transferase-like glycosyltransferase